MAEAPAIGIDLGTTYRYTRSCSRRAVRAAGSHAEYRQMHHRQRGQLYQAQAACAAADCMNSCLGDCVALYHAFPGISALQDKEATVDAPWKRRDDQ